MRKITQRQQEVLDFIKNYIDANNYPPSIRDISEEFSISVKGAYDHVKALEKKEFIRCENNRSRAIEILDDDNSEASNTVKVPILGTVAAGIPIFSEENYDGHLDLPEASLKNGHYFALRVRGDSMRDAGIMSDDIAVIYQQNNANNGDIVVALVDDAVTLKRFFKEPNRIRLQAENPAYPPIYTQNVKILGKLSQIHRNYD